MKKEIEIVVSARQECWQTEPQFFAHMNDMSEYGYSFIGRQTIELDIPDDYDIRPGMINVLEAKRQKAIADHQALMTAIDGEIQKLRAIDYKRETVAQD